MAFWSSCGPSQASTIGPVWRGVFGFFYAAFLVVLIPKVTLVRQERTTQFAYFYKSIGNGAVHACGYA